MGGGIVQVSAQAGHQVTLLEVSDPLANKCVDSISKNLAKVAKKKFQDNPAEGEAWVSKIMGNIKTSTSIPSAVSHADLVIEAIVENIEAKAKIFQEVDKHAPADAIFCTNTSSLCVSKIGSASLSTARIPRFGGLHFFNPVPLMKLVEVISTKQTSKETTKYLDTFCQSIGKTTVLCGDTPGFVVNRLLVPYILESMRLYESGVASKEDIDTAMKLGAGYPMGPLELADLAGLDTLQFVLQHMREQLPNHSAFTPVKILDDLVAQGKLGKKTGEGFYKYT